MTQEQLINITTSIEKLVKTKNCGYLDAVIMYAETHDIEQEIMSKLLSEDIVEQIRREAESLHLIKKTNKKKVLFHS